jgi:hypothetical protein
MEAILKKKKTYTKALTIRISDEQYLKIHSLQDKYGIPLSKILRNSLDLGVAVYTVQILDSLKDKSIAITKSIVKEIELLTPDLILKFEQDIETLSSLVNRLDKVRESMRIFADNRDAYLIHNGDGDNINIAKVLKQIHSMEDFDDSTGEVLKIDRDAKNIDLGEVGSV